MTLIFAGPAKATTIHVTETGDPPFGSNGACSLREAIIGANLDGGVDSCEPGFFADTIIVSAGYHRLAQSGDDDNTLAGDLDVMAGGLTIRGAGPTATIIDGASIDRVFHVLAGGRLTLQSLTVTGGDTAPGTNGGGALNFGELTLRNAVLFDNQASWYGGGIFNGDTLKLFDSTILRNTAGLAGGGIQSNGGNALVVQRSLVAANRAGSVGGGMTTRNAVITETVITDNYSAFDAGGIEDVGGSTLSRSVIARNTSAGPNHAGGGIKVCCGTTLTNVTVTNNSAARGGGIYAAIGNVLLQNVTLAENRAAGATDPNWGGNLNNSGGTVQVKNSLFVSDLAGGECRGDAVVDLGHNLAFDADSGDNCGFTQAATLHLGPLGNHGGATPTRSIAPGDEAVNSGAGCASTDQRGVPRPQGGGCDVGAYELARCLGGIVNRVGTPGADRMTGTTAAEVFLTLGGNDTVSPAGGADRVCAGAGKDTVKIRGGGRDRANGGAGRDRVQRDASDVVQAFEVFF